MTSRKVEKAKSLIEEAKNINSQEEFYKVKSYNEDFPWYEVDDVLKDEFNDYFGDAESQFDY